MSAVVSVIIPCYNSATFLREAIDCVLGQTYLAREVIVVDDGSTDSSAAIMDSYNEQIRVVRQPNAGLPAARNAGIKMARGQYFAFLDADDYWDPGFLEKMIGALALHHADIAYCGWQNVGLPGGRGQPFVPPDYEAAADKMEVFFAHPRWPVHAAVVSKAVIGATDGFDPKWKSCEDFAFWIRVAPKYKLVCVPEVLAFYRFHGEQMTANRSRMALSHLAVQDEYLRDTPEVEIRLGAGKVRELMYGRLLNKGFEAYWSRDLDAARDIFKVVMRAGYGKPKDWLYMLPAWLPSAFHRAMLGFRDNRAQGKGK